ncbi:MAG TPA: DUF4136 domain-containing protein [Steroidobacteraceae bacterium]|nr:DUF4136 domain-containing protein [Steroidobacteraceae bacterium]
MIPVHRLAGKSRPWLPVALAAGAALFLAACQTRPEIRTQSAPELNALQYRTFGFVDHPDTDNEKYTTLVTRYLKDAVTREMLARGYTESAEPDLLINFRVASKDKIESYPGPAVGVGYGRWGWRNWGWGVGYGGSDVRTVTEGSLTIDVVDRRQSALVWRGVAQGRLTKQALDHPQPAIDDAVAAIFAKYPKDARVASAAPTSGTQ